MPPLPQPPIPRLKPSRLWKKQKLKCGLTMLLVIKTMVRIYLIDLMPSTAMKRLLEDEARILILGSTSVTEP